jgi:hypothetical protein
MNEIAQMVSQKFNVSPETAQQIISFVFEQVKGKLPEGLSQHLEGFMAGAGTTEEKSGGLIDSFKNMASSLVNKA